MNTLNTSQQFKRKKMPVAPGLRQRVHTVKEKEDIEHIQVKKKGFTIRYCLKVLRNVGSIFLAIYLITPVWFCYCPWLRRQCVFLHNFNWPPFQTRNLSIPEHWGLNTAHHFFVDSEPGVHLGVWHIPPKSEVFTCHRLGNAECEVNFDTNKPVILYLHGNSMNRAAAYRRALYKVLTESEIEAHVITFDYRGFGDSTSMSPSVVGLVSDGEAMYSWLRKKVDRSRIFLWGHSLGTGVTVQMAAKLRKGDNPAGIILESPFTSIHDATQSFPLSILHRSMPFFDVFFSRPTRHTDTNFNSDEKVHMISAPILILHAADDDMVSVELGRELHKKAQNGLASRSLQYYEFNSSNSYGHLNIHKAPELPKIVSQFMKKCQKSK